MQTVFSKKDFNVCIFTSYKFKCIRLQYPTASF